MKKEVKAFQIKEISGDGEITAVLATLDAVDSDGDVTIPGAFGKQEAPIQPAHDWASVPLGKAKVYEDGPEAKVDMFFNLDIPVGRDWFTALEFDFEMGTEPLQQYSYGYEPTKFRLGEFEKQNVRFLDEIKVHEVSPVLLGAGINTRTLAVKNGIVPGNFYKALMEMGKTQKTLEDEFQSVEGSLADLSGFYGRVKALAVLRTKEGRTLSTANRQRLSHLVATISEIQSDIEKFLAETDPDEDGKSAVLYTQYLKKQLELEHLLRY